MVQCYSALLSCSAVPNACHNTRMFVIIQELGMLLAARVSSALVLKLMTPDQRPPSLPSDTTPRGPHKGEWRAISVIYEVDNPSLVCVPLLWWSDRIAGLRFIVHSYV